MKRVQALSKQSNSCKHHKADWLIVGLGNPGVQYAQTRHNIGWMVLETLATEQHISFLPGRGDWFEAFATLANQNIILLLPTTYMNLSGRAVLKAQRLYALPTERIVAVVDEFNFPVGKIHLKNSGSGGGHNGVTSLCEELQSQNFLRLRCGIDKNFGQGELVQYVLAPFDQSELPARDAMIQQAIVALTIILRDGTARAMQKINTGDYT